MDKKNKIASFKSQITACLSLCASNAFKKVLQNSSPHPSINLPFRSQIRSVSGVAIFPIYKYLPKYAFTLVAIIPCIRTKFAPPSPSSRASAAGAAQTSGE